MPFCPNCRDEFEDWVKTCPDCHVDLIDELPPLPKKSYKPSALKETYETIIQCKWLPPALVVSVKKTCKKFRTCNWLHYSLVTIFTAIVLFLIFVSQPWSDLSEEEPTQLNIDIRSGQMDAFIYGEDEVEQKIIELAWIYPDRERGIITDFDNTFEFIFIGDNYYNTSYDRHLIYTERAYMVARHLLYRIYDKGNKELTDLFTEIRHLPDETIHGINCLHYIAYIDTNRHIDNLISEINREIEDSESSNPDLYDEFDVEEITESLSSQRGENIQVEYWIAKSDGIFRQIKIGASELLVAGTRFFDITHYRVTFYNINQPIIINPPENLFGDLLPGWYFINLDIDI